jgi:hypothetical protein
MRADQKRIWDRQHAHALLMLALWIVPMLVVGITVAFVDVPGHVLSYLPALLLLAGLVAAQLRRAPVFITVVVFACAINGAAFVSWPNSSSKLFLGVALTARGIREHDKQLAQTAEIIRSRYSPSQTILCHAREYFEFGMRHFQLVCPEFSQYQMARDRAMVNPSGRTMLSIQQGRLEFVEGLPYNRLRQVLLIVPPREQLSVFDHDFDLKDARPVKDSKGTLYELTVEMKLK